MVIKGSIMSDLHMEFRGLSGLPGGDLLILSGDIWTVAPMRPKAQDANSRALRKRYIKFCVEELSKYSIIYLVMGNHEHYGGIFENTANILRDFLAIHAPHAILLDNEYREWEGVRFIGSSLWATYGFCTANEVAIQLGMNDCHQIRTMKPVDDYPVSSKGRTLLVNDIDQYHFQSRLFIKKALQKSSLPCVVITHHAPSYLCLGEGGIFSDAYASNQHKFIEKYKPVLWTYGHTHEDKHIKICDTLVVSNHRGYFGLERCANSFDPTAEDFLLEDVKLRRMFTNAGV